MRPQHVGPIRIQGNNSETVIRYELLRQLGARRIEIMRPMARFADRNNLRAARERNELRHIAQKF
jgi:hypothetical protein